MRNLFRVYDPQQKRYVTDEAPWVITIDGKLAVVNGILNRDDFIVEYCTGLCDKNGTDIYDGDIVKEGIVRNYFDSWYIEKENSDIAEYMWQHSYEYEIVGNIHNEEE